MKLGELTGNPIKSSNPICLTFVERLGGRLCDETCNPRSAESAEVFQNVNSIPFIGRVMPMLEFLRFKLISSSPYLLCHPLSFRSDFFFSHFLFSFFLHFSSLSPPERLAKIFKVDVVPKDEKNEKISNYFDRL